MVERFLFRKFRALADHNEKEGILIKIIFIWKRERKIVKYL